MKITDLKNFGVDELTSKEAEEVKGGFLPFLIALVVGFVVTASYLLD
ncbi:hypothetical protein ACSBL2_26395 [Pedobacter sp. AW31-3R]